MTVRGIGRRGPVLGSLEKAVLDVLWAGGGSLTGRRVHAQLSMRRPVAYVTVTTVLARLTAKGLVLQCRDGRAFRYSAVCSHAGQVGAHMADLLGGCAVAERRAVADRFVAGLDADEVRLLRALLRVGASAAAA